MGVASLRAMIGLLDSLQREDSPGIHTLHPAVLYVVHRGRETSGVSWDGEDW